MAGAPLRKTSTFTTDVKIRLPEGNKFREFTLGFEFMLKPAEEDRLLDRDFLQEVLVGCKGIEGDDGSELDPKSADAIDAVLNHDIARAAAIHAYLDKVNGGVIRKNSKK
jgi:hypothetical protein